MERSVERKTNTIIPTTYTLNKPLFPSQNITDHSLLRTPMLDDNPMRTVLLMMITIIDIDDVLVNGNYRRNGS